MAALSLVLTALSVFTFWLVVPMFILPPLAFFFGYKTCKTYHRRANPATRAGRVLSFLPMVLAVAAFVLEMVVMNTEYRA